MKKDLFYAVNGTGQPHVFTSKPIRDEQRKMWLGVQVPCFTMVLMYFESEGLRFPDLKWSDEPVKVELSVEMLKSPVRA